MPAKISGLTATVAALVLAVALVPATLTAQDGNVGECEDPLEKYHVKDDIRASTPLAEQISASQMVKITEEEITGPLNTPEETNGIDAYVHDFGCLIVNRDITLEATTGNLAPDAEADMAIKFYDDAHQLQGELTDEDEDGKISGDIPEHSRYMVIVLEDGPLVSGMDWEKIPAEPYSVHFEATVYT